MMITLLRMLKPGMKGVMLRRDISFTVSVNDLSPNLISDLV